MRLFHRPSAPQLVAAAFFTVLGATWLSTWAWTGSPISWFRPADDAYYYYQLAENVANGEGVSMDGLHETNGFHPLWLLVVTPLFAVLEPTVAGIVGVQVLILLLLAISAGLVCWLSSLRFSTSTAVSSAVALAFPEYRNVELAGVEGALSLLLTLLVAAVLIRSPASLGISPRLGDARLGLLLGLLMLARLDAVFTLLVIALYLLYQAVKTSGSPSAWLGAALIKGLAVFWPVLVLVVPYLILNEVLFGHVVPISGLLKSHFPRVDPDWNLLRHHWEYVLLLLVATAGSFVGGRTRGAEDTFRRAVRLLAGGAWLHFAYTLLFMDGVFWWHFVSYVAPALLGLGYLVEPVLAALSQRLRTAVVAIGIVTMLVFLAASVFHRLPDGELAITTGTRIETQEAAEWARDNLPREAILGMKDSGAFTFYSRRRVVNLDGFANNLEFQGKKCSGQLVEYLRTIGVGYIVQHRVPAVALQGDYERYEQPYPCPDGYVATLHFSRDQEVYRGDPYWSGSVYGPVVIWRLLDAPAKGRAAAERSGGRR